MKHKFQLKDKCYVLLGNNSPTRDRKKYDPLIRLRFDLQYYPEKSMTLIDQVCYRPYVDCVVTESPWIIAWSYGASVDHIYSSILGIRCLLPRIPLNGVEGIKELKKELL
jgi:hypothetical protein